MIVLMGWGFRKSISLGGGTRLNFSKSGVGISTGFKGFRISSGPRGSFISLGSNGIFYRQKISGGGRTTTSQRYTHPPHSSQPSPGNAIPTAGVDQLVDQTAGDLLDKINEPLSKSSFLGLIATLLVILCLVWIVVSPILFPIFLLFSIAVFAYYYRYEKQNKTYPLFFELDPIEMDRWTRLTQAASWLAKPHRIWRVDAHMYTDDWKRQAGASELINRVAARMAAETPPFLKTNILPNVLSAGNQTFAFLPDRLYVFDGQRYGAVAYSDLRIGIGTTRFIEEEGVPRDSRVVDHTWRYVNKDGSPDRRFNGNIQIPIVEYGIVRLWTAMGMNIVLQVSSVASIEQFRNAMAQFVGSPGTRATGQSTQSSSSTKPPPRPQQSQAIPNCYKVLGLDTECSQDQAAIKFRELARAYHPDLVAHMATEFRVLAETRMKEINVAYSELKALRGW